MADPVTLAIGGVGVAVALTQLGQAVYKGRKDDKQNRRMMQMVQQNNGYGGSHSSGPVTQPAYPHPNTHTLAISHQTMGRQSTFTSPNGWFVSVGHGPEARSSGTFITQTTSYNSGFPIGHVNQNSHIPSQSQVFLPAPAAGMMLPIEYTQPYTTGRVVELPQTGSQRFLPDPANHTPRYSHAEPTVKSKKYQW
ncbi:hypothetical protein Z517_07940 [Fonsecaea pedrosoi CBS 271.37]|uniref:Uncharacterized protein n=1 Tax=Fonsecaea pedrosoi CBS 271.37 TaxID=1442368 RepID=A0A0D2EV53_9EURO|nr:uncharacterized protein Z517_07940 [Fonsecaea pedrosoi CBS 271.37]KIW78107.1 hypothetical protein Z517_07940 [Fonsecaea pedrosoi CBS 271.37]